MTQVTQVRDGLSQELVGLPDPFFISRRGKTVDIQSYEAQDLSDVIVYFLADLKKGLLLYLQLCLQQGLLKIGLYQLYLLLVLEFSAAVLEKK